MDDKNIFTDFYTDAVGDSWSKRLGHIDQAWHLDYLEHSGLPLKVHSKLSSWIALKGSAICNVLDDKIKPLIVSYYTPSFVFCCHKIHFLQL